VAKEEILKGSGTQFDPQVVAAFLSVPQSEWEELRAEAEAEAEVAAKIMANPRSPRLNFDFFHSYFPDLSMKQF
jgi:HD-GYP domain-containing protein (c-di-GMP phosphodiesterase class II)